MTKIALVDDHKLLRKGLAALISGQGYSVILQADNGKAFIEQLREDQLPDVVLLDINMPVMDGFQTLQWIKDHHPDINVIALSMYDQETSVIRMLKGGAKGYLIKDSEPDELRRAIETVLQKGFYSSELVSSRLIHNLHYTQGTETGDDLPLKLTKREIEFLGLICTDLTYKEIASRMSVSPRTVDGYRDNLFEKLNVKSRVSLALYAIRQGYVQV
jgi:two-component system, NarL family, invasion response regulator UvrY